MRNFLILLLAGSFLCGAIVPVSAQNPSPSLTTPTTAQAATDPAAATQAWLDTVPADKRAKSDA